MKENIIILNDSCNLNCTFCFNNKENPKNLEFREACYKIKESSLHNKDKIIITGGEPTICSFLPKLIKFSKIIGFKKVLLQTNGVLLDEKKLKILKDLGLTSILISIHSSNESTYNKITQTRGNFEKAIQAIRSVIKFKFPLNLSYVINEHNYSDIYKDLKYFADNFNINMFEIGYTYKLHNKQKVKLIRFSKFIMQLLSAFDYLEKSKNKFIIAYCGLPLCILRKYKCCSSQFLQYVTKKGICISGKTEYLNDINKLLIKTKKCDECTLKQVCFGIPREYYKQYSDDDIFPSSISKEEVFTNFIKFKNKFK